MLVTIKLFRCAEDLPHCKGVLKYTVVLFLVSDFWVFSLYTFSEISLRSEWVSELVKLIPAIIHYRNFHLHYGHVGEKRVNTTPAVGAPTFNYFNQK